jgi:hypothetical protein
LILEAESGNPMRNEGRSSCSSPETPPIEELLRVRATAASAIRDCAKCDKIRCRTNQVQKEIFGHGGSTPVAHPALSLSRPTGPESKKI